MHREEIKLIDIANVEEWQSIQDQLSDVMDVTLRTFSPSGELISKTSRPNRVCDEIFPNICKNSDMVTQCLIHSRAENLRKIKKVTCLKCPFGLEVFVIPLNAVGDKIIAYIILGPIILKSRKTIEECAKEAEHRGMNVDIEELHDALIELSLFSYSKANSVVKLVSDIFLHLAQSGYHKMRLGVIKPEVIELDPLFSRYYEEKILTSLLKTCTYMLSADSGSIMTLDKRSERLHIKVSSDIDDDIAKKTDIALGEGIAGVAAKSDEPIILPKDEVRAGLSNMMKRRYIKSSMVVPFKRSDSFDVYGVINLNIVRKEKEFSSKDIAVVKELINMASVALIPIKEAIESDSSE
ncbi:PocR ligand-binding domain-containing protein [Candidatus Omnitrophota bacterium]